ncbi:MAG: YtxH domain-containing protein [Bacteroidota bacterium]|nr:YtxH domain-containing protein [Bacteroidota bacterium]
MALSNKKMIGALLVAVAAGATIGLLVAPDKGKDTRKKMADKADDLSDKFKKKFTDLVDELKCEYEGIKEKAKDYSETGRS